MSCKVMYTCDHCGKEVSPYIGKQWKAGFLTVGPNIEDIHACSFEHLTLALAKTFYIPLDASTLRLVTEKNDALNAARAAIVECDNMRARLAELEARMPANEVTNAERAQYEATIELQRKRIEELEARIAELATPINANNTSPSLDDLAKKLVPIFEQAYKDGPNDQLASVRAGIRAVLAALPMPITQPVTVDGKTPGQVFDEAFRNGFGKRVVPNPDSELARTHSGELVRDYQREQALDWANATEIGALAVLRAFGNQPSQTPQTNAGAVAMYQATNDAAQRAFPDEPQAITLPTKPTKPLRERLEELATYWYRGNKDDKELNGAYRLARQECAKELREVIDDLR